MPLSSLCHCDSIPLVPRPSYFSPTSTPPFPSFSSPVPLFHVVAYTRAARVSSSVPAILVARYLLALTAADPLQHRCSC